MRKERGSVFILFLWVSVLLSLFALSVGFRVRLATKLRGYERERFQIHYDLLTAVNLARFFIEADEEPSVDFAKDDWYGIPPKFTAMPFSEHFELEIIDEESKVNLNQAHERFLTRFFEVLREHKIKLEGGPEDLSAAILSWRGARPVQGKTMLESSLKRAPFESLEELNLIPSLSSKDVEAMRPFITVFGRAAAPMRVNLNTAQPYILEALIRSLPGSDLEKDDLVAKIEEFRAKHVFQRKDLKAEELIKKIELFTSPSTLRLVNQFLGFITIDSQYFSVRVRSKLLRKNGFGAEAVLGPRIFYRFEGDPGVDSLNRSGRPVGVPLEILSWREGRV